MSANTSIQWTDRTWNPVRGCSRVSAGCDNCYAMNMAHRFSGAGKPFEGLTTIRRGKVDWAGVARFIPEQLTGPLGWKTPQRVFVNSMSDLFHHSVTDAQIAEVFGVMAVAAHKFHGPGELTAKSRQSYGPHVFQVLTKRADRLGLIATPGFRRAVASAAYRHAYNRTDAGWLAQCVSGVREWGNNCTLDAMWPLPNVWIGVSVEDQRTVDERIPLLLKTPAAVCFVSAEPLLERVDLQFDAGRETGGPAGWIDAPRPDWVIAGGESGPGARPCDLEWLESIVRQCRSAGVACFVKQLGSRPCITEEAWRKASHGIMPLLSPRSEHSMVKEAGLVQLAMKDRAGGAPAEWPESLRVREFPRTP